MLLSNKVQDLDHNTHLHLCLSSQTLVFCFFHLIINFKRHLYSLSLRVMSTANTVTEILSLLERMSFRTAEFSSF